MKIPNVLKAARTGNRVGRDRRPMARWVYGLWTGFWAGMATTYIGGLVMDPQGPRDLFGDPVGRGWGIFFAIVSVVYGAVSARIWYQYEGRVAEWATHVREHNAATRARYAPDANPGMFDKEN